MGAGGGRPHFSEPQCRWFPPRSALWREENRSARRRPLAKVARGGPSSAAGLGDLGRVLPFRGPQFPLLGLNLTGSPRS